MINKYNLKFFPTIYNDKLKLVLNQNHSTFNNLIVIYSKVF